MPIQKQRLNRATVIDKAMLIADAEGIDAVTLSRIASDAGVKQPALYKHVTGIEELWMLLSLRARDLLVDALSSAITGTTREHAVLAAAQAWRSFVQEHPGLYSATDGYELTPAQRAHCARSLRSALHGFCVLEKDHGHPEPYALDNSLTQLVELFIRGIETLENH
jgi:AcrR family transcriptional regulator